MPTRASIPVRVVLSISLIVGCRNSSESDRPSTLDVPATAAAAGSSLVDRVWLRSDSTGLPGVMRIFLSDSTLVMDSCWETYRLARWQWESESTLRWQEHAADIQATIRSLENQELVLVLSLRSGSEEQHYTAARAPFVCPDMKR